MGIFTRLRYLVPAPLCAFCPAAGVCAPGCRAWPCLPNTSPPLPRLLSPPSRYLSGRGCAAVAVCTAALFELTRATHFVLVRNAAALVQAGGGTFRDTCCRATNATRGLLVWTDARSAGGLVNIHRRLLRYHRTLTHYPATYAIQPAWFPFRTALLRQCQRQTSPYGHTTCLTTYGLPLAYRNAHSARTFHLAMTVQHACCYALLVTLFFPPPASRPHAPFFDTYLLPYRILITTSFFFAGIPARLTLTHTGQTARFSLRCGVYLPM